jgi:uncharacterized protein
LVQRSLAGDRKNRGNHSHGVRWSDQLPLAAAVPTGLHNRCTAIEVKNPQLIARERSFIGQRAFVPSGQYRPGRVRLVPLPLLPNRTRQVPPHMIERLVALVAATLRNRRRTLSVGAAIACACLPLAILLYGNLRSSIEELLPKSAPSIRALDELHRRLGDNLQLAVLVSGAPKEDLHRFADKFADLARGMLSGAPRFIDYRPAEVQDFFRARKALFIDTPDLATLEQRIRARVDYEVENNSPMALHLDDDEPSTPPPVVVDDIVKKYDKRTTGLKQHPSGYYDADDGRSLAMIFYPAKGVTGYEASLRFREGLRNRADQAKADLGLGTLRIDFAGDIESLILEQRSLQSDLVTSSIVVLVAELLLILLCFGWKPSFAALGFPLSVGTLLTFAVSYLAIGSVNASTAFLGSIIVGNGVNSGIILLARFLEERRNGQQSEPAMTIAVRETAAATAVASGAAALSYGALMTTTFRGYSHFGFMGGTGMVLCWIAMYLLLPGTAVALDARWPVQKSRHNASGIWDRLFGAIGRVGLRHAAPTLVGAAVVAVAATVMVARFARDPFEYDTTKLLSRTATEPGGFLEIDHQVDDILKRVITPVVVLVDREADAQVVADAYRRLIDEAPAGHLLGEVLTIESLVPRDQAAKLAILGRISDMLRGDRLDKLAPDQRDSARELLAVAGAVPFTAADLPESIRRQFRELDGSEGKLVLLFPRHGADTRDGRVVLRLAREVRSQPLVKGAVVAGSYLVFSDMLASISHDGPLATVLALLFVVLLSLGLARGATGTLAVTGSLVLGVLLTAGAAAAFNVRVNFLNFVALPITFGIGLDYAVNIYGRISRGTLSVESLADSVTQSGGAVALCSATTIIGYCSLLFSRNGALFSFGMLAVVGEVACLFCALLLLPAMLGRAGASYAPCHGLARSHIE